MKNTDNIDEVIKTKLVEAGMPAVLAPELLNYVRSRALKALTEAVVSREFGKLRAQRHKLKNAAVLAGASDSDYRAYIEASGYHPSDALVAAVKFGHQERLNPAFFGDVWRDWGHAKSSEKKEAARVEEAPKLKELEAGTSGTDAEASEGTQKSKTKRSQALAPKPDAKPAPNHAANDESKKDSTTASPARLGEVPQATHKIVPSGQQNQGSFWGQTEVLTQPSSGEGEIAEGRDSK